LAIIPLVCAASKVPPGVPLQIVDVGIDTRVVALRRADATYGAAGRSLTSIVQHQGGSLELGFVHSGYTADDPDGRTATLTVTVSAPLTSLSLSDVAALAQKGIVVTDAVRLQLQSRELDLEVRDDPVEEKRLRVAAGLPKPLTSPSSSVPIQLRWTNRDGKSLYRLMTADGGLRFVVRDRFLIRASNQVTVSLRPAVVSQMLDDAGSPPQFGWSGGRTALAMAIADRGGFEFVGPLGGAATPYPAYELFEGFLNSLGAFLCADDGICSIEGATLRSVRWSTVLPGGELQLPGSGVSAVSPGSVLDTHPEYVKDLSGTGVGLKALLQGQ
jgi:hypothetical protein